MWVSTQLYVINGYDDISVNVQGIQEFTDQIPLVTGFAEAYASVNAEQAQKVKYIHKHWTRKYDNQKNGNALAMPTSK